MRAESSAELDELRADLASMGRLAGQIMISASAALLQTDLALAELVVAQGDEMDAQHDAVEQRCVTLPALGAADLPTVVALLQAVEDLQQMGELARHIARMTWLIQPNLAVSDDVRTVFAQMSLLAGGLAHQAATAIEKLDPFSGDRLARTDDEVDSLCRQLSRLVFAEDWSYGKGSAMAAARLGRYYECFADHAVAMARRVCSST